MMLEERGIGAIIKPRRNSVLNTYSPAKRRAVRRFCELGYEVWAKLKGYSRRWMAENAFSTFKRLFGERCMARSLENIARELVTKSPSITYYKNVK